MSRFSKNFKILGKQRSIYLLVGLFIAGFLLVATHLLTVQITASTRAYIAGESEYSKAQKDAARHLILYTLEGKPEYYAQFRQELEVYRGDSIARVTLLNGGDQSIVRHGFVSGKNHPEDVDDLMWLLANFHGAGFMQRPIELWEEGDSLVAELATLGYEVRNAQRDSLLHDSMKEQLMSRIEALTLLISEKERDFSAHLGELARTASRVLLVVNALFILLIVITTALLIALALRSLENSRIALRVQNEELMAANKKLDSFLYAASHDLKSPIHNIEGLVSILLTEEDNLNDEQRELLAKVRTAAQNLNRSIVNIENLMRSGRHDLDDVRELEFETVLRQILEENEMSFLISEGEISWDFAEPKLHYSAVAMKSILFNLVSNAIKYQSPARKLELKISTFNQGSHTILEVTDNGVGIDLEKYGDAIFGMFNRFHRHESGTGLGLYAVKRIVEQHKGNIEVESEVDRGTTFRIQFPKK